MSEKLFPYLGSLELPKTFSEDWDAGRRYAFRGFGHLLLFLGIIGLGTGYTQTVLTVAIILGLLTVVRGHIAARSRDEWEDERVPESSDPATRVVNRVAPFLLILAIIAFGGSVALVLATTTYFMVGVVGIIASSCVALLLLR